MNILLGDKACPVEQTAARILAEELTGENRVHIGTPESSQYIRRLGLTDLHPEGFVAKQINDTFVIAAADAQGTLYGAAAVAEKLRMGQQLADIDLNEQPALKDRMLWLWGQPKSRPDAFLTLDRLEQCETDPAMWTFGKYLAQARVNALILWPDTDVRPDLGPAIDTSLDAYRTFTRWLRESFGLDVYLFMWYEINQGTELPINGWPVCTFNERVRKHWQDWHYRLARELPDINGVIMAGAGGDWIRGPWECECEQCRQHTKRELLQRAMEMIGKPWADRGGRLIWKAVTDRPSLVGTEVENFANLDDMLPSYTTVAHKPFYKDFRQPHPLHPLFFQHQDQQDNERPYLLEFQIFGEYRGMTWFPCSMVDRWSGIAPMMTSKNYRGSIGIACFSDRNTFDHPLNMVNWYAWGRQAWNPNTLPEDIYRDWTTMTFGADAADAVIDVCRKSYDAATKLMFFKGVMTQNHSKLPTNDYELESSLIGPWHNIPKAKDGMIGRAHDVSMYPPEIAEQIRNDPSLTLWAHRIPITPELCDEAITQKRNALQLLRDMATEWQAIPHETWAVLHADITQRFARNLIDVECWVQGECLYWDYKAGRLTRNALRQRLDEITSRFDATMGTNMIAETFDRFVEEWQRVLDGNFTRRSMEGDHRNPEGEPFLPGLKND